MWKWQLASSGWGWGSKTFVGPTARSIAVLTCVLGSWLGIGSATDAAAITEPASVQPGEPYRIMFVTSTTRDGNGYIADFDAHVQAAVANSPELSALNTTWRAVVSTLEADGTEVHARDHAEVNDPDGQEVPIYNTAGWRSATTLAFGVFYDTSETASLWENPLGQFNYRYRVAIEHDENGNEMSGRVWTGTLSNGSLSTNHPLGLEGTNTGAAGGYGTIGDYEYDIFGGTNHKYVSYHVYGISGELVIPEPASLLVLTAAAPLLLRRRP